MEYTTGHYNEDMRIANWVFNKYFKQYSNLKDDMIQVAVIKLWQSRPKFNRAKGTYATFACLCAYREMLVFLRTEKRHMFNASVFEEIEDGLMLIDTIGAEDNRAFDLLELEELVKQIKNLVHGLDTRAKKIIELYLKHYSQAEISERVGISRSYVARHIMDFRELLKSEIGI